MNINANLIESDALHSTKPLVGQSLSSAHSGSDQGTRLSELEFGLVIASSAFNRWAVRCMEAAGERNMSIIDILVLLHVDAARHAQRHIDIALSLGIKDAHVINYSLKKLLSLKLLQGARLGKNVMYSTSPRAHTLCARYASIRQRTLVAGLAGCENDRRAFNAPGRYLHTLSSAYDSAARALDSE